MEWNYFESIRQAKRGYSKVLEPVCGGWELTRSELDVLLYLANNPARNRAADIVTNRGMVKSQVSLSVNRLLERGLLRSREDENDRRTVRLQPTEAAEEIICAGREAQERFFRGIFAGVTREEMEAWQTITEKVRDNIRMLEE